MRLLTLDQIDPLNFRLERAVPNVAAQASVNAGIVISDEECDCPNFRACAENSGCLKECATRAAKATKPVAAAPISPPEPLEAGWVAHDGGPCPVPEGTLIELRVTNRDGSPAYTDLKSVRSGWRWNHSGTRNITHYRIIK